MRAIDRWRALDADERRITIRSAFAIVSALTIVKLAGLRRALGWAHQPPRARALSNTRAQQLVSGIDRAGRYLPGATCLTRSLALARVLRDEGLTASVMIGTMKRDDFAAHAWVACDGIAMTDARGAEPLLDNQRLAGKRCLPANR